MVADWRADIGDKQKLFLLDRAHGFNRKWLRWSGEVARRLAVASVSAGVAGDDGGEAEKKKWLCEKRKQVLHCEFSLFRAKIRKAERDGLSYGCRVRDW